MKTFQKSIQSELLKNFGGSTVILSTIVITIMLIRILGQASKGQAAPSEVILLVALNGVGNAGRILTLSMCESQLSDFLNRLLNRVVFEDKHGFKEWRARHADNVLNLS